MSQCCCAQGAGWRAGRVLRDSSDWDDRMEAKITPAPPPPLPPPVMNKKTLDQNFTPPKSHAEFTSSKSVQKEFTLVNDKTRT